jgi:transcriptional regulator with XRE-family HTH domain
MVSEARRAAIRRQYRLWRAEVERTQLQVETLARLDAGKFWKIENGFCFPDDEERKRLARVLRVSADDLPGAQEVAKAS